MTMQLLPVMNMASLFLLPIFFEGIFVVFAAALKLLYENKISRKILIQIFPVVLIGITISCVIKMTAVSRKQQTGLECAIIQGGYSANDY
jgi:hypothetical protein